MKIESKDELKKIDIKTRTCDYFDDIMRVVDIDFDNNLLNEKSNKIYEIIFIYDIHTMLLWVQNHCVFGSKK